VPNETDNPYFGDVVTGALSRRGLLQGMGAGALVVTAATTLPAAPAAASPGAPSMGAGAALASGTSNRAAKASKGALTFQPVRPNVLDELVTAPGYAYDVVMRWGDPVTAGAPAFDVDRQTPQAQAQQFGYNCDYIGFLPLGSGRDAERRGLLVVNHEYTDEQLMFPGVESQEAPTTAEQKRIAMAAHGISVVELLRVGRTGQWRQSPRRNLNRRITAMTPTQLTGPVAGSEYVRTSADPSGTRVLGTLNNCAGGMTPWGTTLHGEENFNQYFGTSARITEDPKEPRLARYGISTSARPVAGGTRSTAASTWRRSRTRSTASAGSSSSTRTTPSRCPASGPPSAASSTRARTSASPRTAGWSPTRATTSASTTSTSSSRRASTTRARAARRGPAT
jgi:secreted PhoX family phosphatase